MIKRIYRKIFYTNGESKLVIIFTLAWVVFLMIIYTIMGKKYK